MRSFGNHISRYNVCCIIFIVSSTLFNSICYYICNSKLISVFLVCLVVCKFGGLSGYSGSKILVCLWFHKNKLENVMDKRSYKRLFAEEYYQREKGFGL